VRDSLADWLTALGTVGAVLVALFREPLMAWWRSPRLEVEFEQDEPFCRHSKIAAEVDHRTGEVRDVRPPCPAYWIRLRLKNSKRFRILGGSVAKKCEGKLAAVRAARLERQPEYDPAVLHWVSRGRRGAHAYESIDLNYGEEEYLNVFHTEEARLVAFIDTDPELRGTPSVLPPGEHYLDITIYGENFGPVQTRLHVQWDGERYDRITVIKL